MALAERHDKTNELTYWEGEIPVNYVYTTGRAGEAFFKAVGKGKLLAAKCDACDVTYVPPKTYCERCFKRIEDSYKEVTPKGAVHAFTVCHKKMDGTPSDKPIVMAVVKIDKTDGGVVHYLGEVKPETVHIGMPVKAVFKPRKERQGSILDIAYFKP
jgi:uncharacterized OB-fold protein